MKRSICVAAAFSLIEVTLAIGIAAFCLITIIGIIPVGVQTNRNAASKTAAMNIIAAVVADLRATPPSKPASGQFSIPFGTSKTLYFPGDGNGQFTTSLNTNSRYQVSVTWPSSGWSGLLYADVKVWWPAAATAANASGSTETFAGFDRN